ncbi:MAG TPA: NAD(P)-dependent oxidoreductase [Xanthomonadales bacterium]|nr:NAD(P)-dependent oxidoreductase [Xanthomonadales bacterium]
MGGPLVAITGSGGRVGRAIVAALAAGHRVRTLDRDPAANADLVGETDDPALLDRLLDDADALIHVAALHAPHVGVHPDDEFERINVAGTRAVIDAVRRAGTKRVLFTSTTALYGDASTPKGRAGWVTEATEPKPRTIYHRTKLAGEALLREAAGQGAFALRILRMSRCFPERAPLMAAYRLHRGVDARDVAEAHRLALADGDAHEKTWIVSAPTPFAREDVEALAFDARPVIERRAPLLAKAFAARDWPLPRTIDRIYDSSAIQRELGWRARYGFESVLAQLDAGDPEVLPAS